ncbi:MAG: hypothetical protein JRI86_08305 [Deltaproteobacteria bacterium]|nr:hypothetical protein [Deltaproteobacteria bacterium]
MEMQNGTYINFPIQYIFKTYSNTVAGNVYATENPSIVPSLLLLHKRDQLAGYFAATVVGGGGKVGYKHGSATTIGYGTLLTSNPLLNPPYDIYKNQHVEAESVYKGYLFGGAYKLNDMVSILGIKLRASISLGIRYVDAAQSAKASLTLDSSFVPAAPDMLVNLDYEKEAAELDMKPAQTSILKLQLIRIQSREAVGCQLEMKAGVISLAFSALVLPTLPLQISGLMRPSPTI